MIIYNKITWCSEKKKTKNAVSVGQPGQSTKSIESPKFKNPDPMLHLVQHHFAILHASSPGVMTALALQTS